jgi:cytochrome P450 family 110
MMNEDSPRMLAFAAVRLPPGPRGRLVQSARYGIDPYRFLQRGARRHGDVFTIPLVTGPVVALGHPEGARAVFTAPPETFAIWAREQLLPVFGAGSLFVVTGEDHRRQRRAIMPALAGIGDMDGGVRAHVDRLRAGQELDVTRMLLDLSLDIILGDLFGDDAAIRSAARRYAEAAHAPALVLPLVYPRLRLLVPRIWFRFVRARRELLRLLDARPGTGRIGRALAEAGLSPVEVRDNLVTLLLAGYETTAMSAAWALYSLTREPDVSARLIAELDGAAPSVAGIDALPYLDAVCEETLRLHPVVVQVTRTLTRPLTVGGHTLPAGVSVSPSASLVHRRADVYPEPDRFRPERFLERRFTPFENFPFGGGPTRCPGATFGKTEMKLILAHLLRAVRLEPLDPRPVKAIVSGLVMVPDRPLRMRLHRR